MFHRVRKVRNTMIDVLRTYRRLYALFVEAYYNYAINSFPQFKDDKCLARYGFKVYSQTDEDGIIEEIFTRIGVESKYFVEIGVSEDGRLENNTLYLLLKGWKGAWLEANSNSVTCLNEKCSNLIAVHQLKVKNAFIDVENAERLFSECCVPVNLDLLSIDIDGNDYWIWRAIKSYQPRVVVIEYTAGFGPTAEWIMKYDPKWVSKGTRAQGASLKSLEKLGYEKGYSLVGCNFSGINAFFVRQDLAGDKFLEPYIAEIHYQAPKNHLLAGFRFLTGHPVDSDEIKSFGNVEKVEVVE